MSTAEDPVFQWPRDRARVHPQVEAAVRRVCRRYGIAEGGEEDDVHQDVWFQLLQPARPPFPAPEDLVRYACVVAANYLKRQGRKRRPILLDPATAALVADSYCGGGSIHEYLALLLEAATGEPTEDAVVHRERAKLRRFAEAIRLRFEEDCTFQTIAKRMDCPTTTAVRSVTEALEWLRRRLRRPE